MDGRYGRAFYYPEIGAVLSQGEGEEVHPVVYISLKLSNRERKYATVEGEAFKLLNGHWSA